MSQPNRVNALIDDPGPVEPIDFERHLAGKRFQIQNDACKHLLQLPDEPYVEIREAEKRTAVSEIPAYEPTQIDPVVLSAIEQYAAPSSKVINIHEAQYGKSYKQLPPNDLQHNIFPLQYEPEIDKENEIINPSDKRGWLLKLKSTVSNSEKFSMKELNRDGKKRWAVLRKVQEGDDTTGYLLECLKDEKEEHKGKNAKGVTYFLAEPIFEAFPFDETSKDQKKRFGFELRMQNSENDENNEEITVNAVFVAENEEDRDDWVSRINDALASSKRQELEEDSDPEDIVDEEKIQSRFSATQNNSIYSYLKESQRYEDLARKRRRNRNRILALSSQRESLSSAGNSKMTEISEVVEDRIHPVRFVLRAAALQFHLRGSVRELNSEISNLEPFFVTFALYDAKSRKKISADFHAQMNDEILKNLTNPVGINDYVSQMFGEPERKKINYSWIENPKQAIFDIYQPHEQIFLVAKIERVLQGSISKTSQPYCEKADSEKIVNSIIKQVKSACNRIPEHRMPFAWGAVSLFDKKGAFAPAGFHSVRTGEQENYQLPFGDLYRQEANKLKNEELFKFLAEIGKSGKNLDKLDRIYRPPNLSLLTVIIEIWLKIIKKFAISD